jgi:hypothetical protein
LFPQKLVSLTIKQQQQQQQQQPTWKITFIPEEKPGHIFVSLAAP